MKQKILLRRMIRTLLLMFSVNLFAIWNVTAQDHKVSGIVTDSKSGEPIIGATVYVEGTSNGNITGTDGKYELTIDTNSKLSISFVGYIKQTIEVNGRTQIDIALVADNQEMEEVVVVGYGVVKKRDLTGAISNVKSDQIVKMATSGVTGALVGKVAGLQITNTSGGPGDGNNVVRIRGGNSISGSNDPLWVIDGFISAGGASSTPAEDIESVEILKDASATAIYGARGANGVIIVTTKRGKAGATNVTVRSNVGVNWMSRELPLMNGPQTYDYWNAFDKNYLDSRIDPKANFDWINAVTRNSLKQTHYIAVSGGKEGYAYNVSAEYAADEGIIKYNSDTKRLNVRAAFDFDLSKKVKMGITTRYRYSEDNTVGDGDFFQMILRMSPLVAPFKEDGSYNFNLNHGNLSDALGVDLYSKVKGNPIQYVRESLNPSRGGLFNGQAFLNYEPIKGLIFRTEFSYNKNNKWNQSYKPSTIDVMTPAKLQHSEGESYEWVNTATYKKDFGKHSINTVVGQTLQSDINSFLSGSNKYFAADGFTWNNLGQGNPIEIGDIGVGSGYKSTSILSYLARVNYVYNDKYLFTVSGRADGASKFSKNNKWGYFPSGAVSWRASEEDFIEKMDLFSTLKFRASVGITGSEAIKPYETLGLMSGGTILISSSIIPPYGTPTQIFISDKLANDNLTWESTVQTDFGIDMGFFKNKLSLTLDIYNKDTRDLLLYVPVLPESGYDVKLSNVGKVNNKGIEFSINAIPVISKNFEWSTNLNISRNKNKVVSLGGASKIDQSSGDMPETTYLEVGRPLGIMYGYVTNGIWQTDEEIANYPHRSSDKPGDYRIVDTNKDGFIDSKDKVALGDPNPKFTFGWGNTLTYKNLEFSFFFSGAYGNDVCNFNKHKLMVDTGRHGDLINYWTAVNESQTHTSAGNTNVAKMIDKYIEDGSFIKLKNTTMKYTFPSSMLKKAKIKELSVYLTASDIWTITNYSGINPEANQSDKLNTVIGIDYSTYPLNSSVIGGITFNF